MKIYRVDIFFVRKNGFTIGSEQDAGRPRVVVSNNTGNSCSNIVEVVPLTTALCECVTNVSQDRLVEYIRSCSHEEMEAIDKALIVALGLNEYIGAEPSYEPVPVVAGNNEGVIKLTTERDLYKHLYEQMFERMVR